MTGGTVQPGASPAARTPLWLQYALLVVFGLFFAYDVWEAVGNLLVIAATASALETSVTALGWVILVLSALLPLIAFGAAYLIGRRRGPISQVLLYLTALGTSAATYLSVGSLFGVGSFLS
ncbi:hypothetical protein GCM10027416_13260 [Okibacterium endophyticum]